METNQVFDKLNDACERVLKSQGSSVSIETRAMTLDQFAEYAMDQIQKAGEEKSSPRAALARIQHLHRTISVAKSAFAEAKVETFEIPMFKGDSIVTGDIEARFKGIEDSITNLANVLTKGGKSDDEEKDEDEEKKKAKGKAEDEEDEDKFPFKGKGKGGKKAKADDEDADKDEDEEKKKAKADDEDADKDEDEEKKKAKGDDDADKDDDDVEKAMWPMDLAKSHGRSKDEADLYDWGSDPA